VPDRPTEFLDLTSLTLDEFQQLVPPCEAAFQQRIDDAGVERVVLPPRSPNLHAYAERWVRSVKEECLSRMILCGEASLRHALTQYVEHFHHERNPHSPELCGKRIASHSEGRSTLDVPLIHEVPLQEQK
jgi:hypothetical protein